MVGCYKSPSRPANGESFAINAIAIVGGSSAIGSNRIGFSGSVIVSPTVISIPLTATISPTSAFEISFCSLPSNV